MPEKNVIGRIADHFQEHGYGLVLACSYSDGPNFNTRCFSTVSQSDIVAVLSRTSANISQLAFDDAGIMVGALVAVTETEKLSELAEWAAEQLEREEPMMLACVSGGEFACFAVGDAPMLVYIAVKLLVSMQQFGIPSFNPFDFTPNLN